jgi:Contractile injection system tube protein
MAQLESPTLRAHGEKGSAFEVSIGSLDEPDKTVSAQYRPKELDVSQTVPWTKHTNKSPEGSLQLEFSGADGRDASIELFFDASETKNGSVQGPIDMLTELATVRDPYSSEDKKKRPHHCVMVFGNIYRKKTFKCVISSVATKFTMFSPDGDPIRATVNLKLKETHLVDMTAEQKKDAAAAKKTG